MYLSSLIRILFVLFTLTYPVGQIARIHLGSSANLYLHDISLCLFLTAWFFGRASMRPIVPNLPLLRPAGFFAAGLVVSIAANAVRYAFFEVVIGSLYFIRLVVYFFTYIAVSDIVRRKIIEKHTVLLLLIGAGVISAVLGIVQYFLYPNLRNLAYLGWDPHHYRLFGTFLDSGYASIILVLTIILVYWVLWNQRKLSFVKLLLLLGLAAALSLTYSRSGFVALVASFGALSVLKKSMWPFVHAGAFVVATVMLLQSPSPSGESVNLARTSTIHARIVNYQESAAIISNNPLVGVGFNMLRYYKRDNGYILGDALEYHHSAAGLDNSFLFIWATSGLVGIAGFGYFCICLISLLRRRLARTDTKTVAEVVLVSLVAVVVHSFFLNSLFYPWTLLWILLLFSLLSDVK